MSYTIDFQRLALKIDLHAAYKQLITFYPDLDQNERMLCPYRYQGQYYLIFSEMGDNNCICDDGKVARNWRLIIANEEPLNEVIAASADAESGYLRLNGRYTIAENYIRCYRKLIQEAIPTDWLRNDFPNGLRLVLRGLLRASTEKDAAWRYQNHPHTNNMKDRIVEDMVNDKVTVDICFSDPVVHALDIAWLFAIKEPGRRPDLDPTGRADYKLSQIARAKGYGVYSPSAAA